MIANTKAGPPRIGVRALGYKYVETLGPDGAEFPLRPAPPARALYDLSADPGETRNLADANPELLAALRQLMWEQRRGIEGQGIDPSLPDTVDPELLERLRSLGYVR
jgi:hypothetical protein